MPLATPFDRAADEFDPSRWVIVFSAGTHSLGHAVKSQHSPISNPRTPSFATVIEARVLRHDPHYGLSSLMFADGELRVPIVSAPVGSGVKVRIYARDVSVALTRPMDVSITNRLPGTITTLEPLALPFVRVTLSLGATSIDALVTTESVDRLALEPGLRAWAMIKTVAIGKEAVEAHHLPSPRRWPVLVRRPD